MPSHSDKQSLLLQRIGIDVWKLRPQEHLATPDKPYLSQSKIAESASGSAKKDEVQSAAPPTYAVQEANTASVSSSAESVNTVASDAPNEVKADATETTAASPTGAVVSWRGVAKFQPEADWCFVCASTADTEKAERKLLKAILFSLGLQASDFSLVWAPEVRESEVGVDKEMEKTNVSDTLASLLANEEPKNIVVFGEQLAQFLIGTDKSIDVLRTEHYRYRGGKSQLVVTFGLSHLLSNSSDKARVWRDLLKARTAS